MKKSTQTLVLCCACILGCVVSQTSCAFTPAAIPPSTPTPTLAPTPTADNREHLRVFETVWGTVNETYFDPRFGGVDWEAVHDKYAPLIAAAPDDETFYDLLNRMLWELNVSHVGVGPAAAWPSVEPVIWESGEIGVDVRLLNGQAVITRLETDSPAEKAGLKTGFVIQKIEGIPMEWILAEMDGPLSPPHTEAGRIDILTRHVLSKIYGEPGTCVRLVYLDGRDAFHEQCIERMQRPRKGYMLPPDYLEAVIIGERSPGGLTAMNITKLPDDVILGYPVAQLVTSNGRVLEGYGVLPDIPVTLDRGQLLKGVDAQLQAGIQFIVEPGQ